MNRARSEITAEPIQGELEKAIRKAIASVDDPCSIAAQAPMSVGELGLVRGWKIDGGVVTVTISPTSPSCILMGSIAHAIEVRVGAVAGVEIVHVEVDTATVWSPSLMSASGRRQLDQRRRTSLLQVPVRPRQWEEKGGTRGDPGDTPAPGGSGSS